MPPYTQTGRGGEKKQTQGHIQLLVPYPGSSPARELQCLGDYRSEKKKTIGGPLPAVPAPVFGQDDPPSPRVPTHPGLGRAHSSRRSPSPGNASSPLPPPPSRGVGVTVVGDPPGSCGGPSESTRCFSKSLSHGEAGVWPRAPLSALTLKPGFGTP
ncbi:hypothetical protein D5F01_LYC11078 [Larimichthys crocea]|uniref:Uncharacterized protein n=1 Tax=Larimichthys crocea TaxID=215358 RepID=A0A6G0IJ62_LARCR|nr:hypothetical protein D5F01_LYC11078 [Larimichthys crocea]